jgi:zinc protease
MNETIDRSKAPLPGPPRPYRFPDVTRVTLDNGLRVLVTENHNAPIVAMRLLVHSGADRDTASHAGLAALVADLLDEGAGTRDAIRLAEDIGLLGAALGSGADWDASYVSLDVLSRNAAAAAEIFAEVVRKPMLPTDGLERVRTERLTELVQQRDEPSVIAGKRFANLIYGTGVYGNSIVGSPESVARLSIEDVQSFYATYYIPNNCSLVIAGDITTDEALGMAKSLFGDWQRASEPPAAVATPQQYEGCRIYLIDRPQAVQSEIRVGHIGVARSTEDYFAISVMNSLLGGVFNSRINMNLREKHGYTYGARSMFAFRKQAGPFVVAAPVRNEVTKEAVNEVFNELRRIRTGDIEGTELEDVKNYLMGVFPATVQSSGEVASRLVDMELYGLPIDYFDRYRENIAAITNEEIRRVAEKYIDPDRSLVVIVGNAKQVREPLGSLGYPIHDIDLEGNSLSVG